jgi:hypothetical protein
MAKYKVSINCIDNYQELEIEAQNEWEAEEKYQEMLDKVGPDVKTTERPK